MTHQQIECLVKFSFDWGIWVFFTYDIISIVYLLLFKVSIDITKKGLYD